MEEVSEEHKMAYEVFEREADEEGTIGNGLNNDREALI